MNIQTAETFEKGENGLYAGVRPDTYHRFEAASNSRLSRLLRSPAHCKASIDEPFEQTPDMILGTAYHLAVLEPDRFEREVVVMGQCDGAKKAGGRCTYQAKFVGLDPLGNVAQYCKRHAESYATSIRVDVFPMSENDVDRVKQMRDATLSHPSAKLLLEGEVTECSALWEFGVLKCKGRLDHWNVDLDTLVDLKKTRDASKSAFARSLYNFGYHRQGAMYLDGLLALGINLSDYTIIAQEDERPFATAVYRIENETIAAGRDELAPLLSRYLDCSRSGHWPAYPDEVTDISLPRWAWNEIYDE